MISCEQSNIVGTFGQVRNVVRFEGSNDDFGDENRKPKYGEERKFDTAKSAMNGDLTRLTGLSW